MTRIALWVFFGLGLVFAVKTGDYDRRFLGLLLAGAFAALLAAKPSSSRVVAVVLVGIAVLPLCYEGLRQGDLGFGFADKGVGLALFAALGAVAVSSGPAAFGYAASGVVLSWPALGYLNHPEFSRFNLLGLSSPYSALLASVLGCVLFLVALRRVSSTRAISFLVGVLVAPVLTWVIDRAIVLSHLL